MVLHRAEGSHLTHSAALLMLREGEFLAQEKGSEDVWGVENLGEETEKALLAWLSQMKTENYMISLSKSRFCINVD